MPVDTTYRHVAKSFTPGALLTAGSARLKWYDVARADTPVPTAIHNMARYVPPIRKHERTLKRDIGFAVLHRCGAGNDFYFLPRLHLAQFERTLGIRLLQRRRNA